MRIDYNTSGKKLIKWNIRNGNVSSVVGSTTRKKEILRKA
jgi:hypothetical protein